MLPLLSKCVYVYVCMQMFLGRFHFSVLIVFAAFVYVFVIMCAINSVLKAIMEIQKTINLGLQL